MNDKHLELLKKRGVEIPDERQVYIGDEVDITRIYPKSVLYPGTRITGSRSLIGPEAKIGTEGSAVINNSVIGEEAEVASGYLHDSVLLEKSRAGANAHFRAGTLLEEEASTAHAVGLKQTILMCYVTCGSLINFCDGLISGGKTRKNHTEVGSGFIHFNFTPWGKSGDKATASLIGNVTDGVFLNQDRIFMGGLSGLVGPQSIGFGAVTVAGQVIRSRVKNNQLFSDTPKKIKMPWKIGSIDSLNKRGKINIHYISQLLALRAWYLSVRLKRAEANKSKEHLPVIIREAIKNIELCIQERISRFNSFSSERGQLKTISIPNNLPEYSLPLNDTDKDKAHISWVTELKPIDMRELKSWLQSVVISAEESMFGQINV